MKRALAAVLLYGVIPTSALAASFYTGVQLDDTATGIMFGYQLDKTYAVELQYTEANSNITHAGIVVDTKSSAVGIVGVARFQMKLRNAMPYSLFVKAGYEHVTNTEDYSIPTTVTLTLPYNDTKTSNENRLILGGGAEYEFTKNVVGRAGLDFHGTDRSIYLAAMYKF